MVESYWSVQFGMSFEFKKIETISGMYMEVAVYRC